MVAGLALAVTAAKIFDRNFAVIWTLSPASLTLG